MHLLALLPLLAHSSSLSPLLDRVAASGRAGEPVVAVAHVALCDNSHVRCGGGGRGDGDDLRRNLYWATSGGFEGWFGRRDGGWSRVADGPGAESEVLRTVIWRRRQPVTAALRARGVERDLSVYVVVHAWRGRAIDRALDHYVRDLWDVKPRAVMLPDGGRLWVGGGAHVVAYIGHNRWMDRQAPYPFPAEPPDAPVKGTITVACMTAAYVGAPLAAGRRVPLLLTRDFVFAGAGAFEGALLALASGRDLGEIRRRAAATYAASEGKPYARVESAFTNPAHARWQPGAAATAGR
jgi:hypothetical protein